MATGRRPEDREAAVTPNVADLHLMLLGGFGVRVSGQDVPEEAFPRRKAMSLLKLLALQPGYQLHREQVLARLWPDLAPRSASGQLYKAVHHIRQAFESAQPPCPADELIQMGGEMVRLSAPGGIQTDVETFEERAREAIRTRDLDLLREAATGYSGDLLPADLYEPWVTGRRHELREQFVDVLIELGQCYLAAGRLAEAADALHQALNRDPARETAHRALMLAFARQGSRARAIRQYRACVDALATELGTDVSAETADLYQDIVNEKITAVQPANMAVARDVSPLPPLVGRRPELKTVIARLDRLAGGRGGVLAIEGDAGIGKTRLAQEILRLGRTRRWHTLLGGAHEQEGQMAYLPFVEALRRALWDNPAGAELIPAELAVAIPEIPASATTVGVTDRVAAQSALFAGVFRFLSARAGTAPVILILDDLHAVDGGSLKLFHYLARQVDQLPLLLVGIWRRHDPQAPTELADVVSNLEREQILQRIMLTGLSERDHQALLEQALDASRVHPELASELYRLTEGNALFAREIARQLRADGKVVQIDGAWRLAGEPDRPGEPAVPAIPQTLQVLTERRLEPLSPAATSLIQLAAVAGREVPFTVIEAGWDAGQTQAAFLDAVDEVLATGLLGDTGLSYRFPHPLLREAIYARMSHSRQRALHREVAATLQSLHQHDPATLPVDVLAYHYRNAGDIDRAAHYLVEAGNRAEAVYDHDGALRRYHEALALLDGQPSPDQQRLRAEAKERIGDVHRATGDVGRSLAAYLKALAALEDEGTDSQPAFSLHRKIALGAILTVDLETAGEHLAQARSLLGPDPLDEARLLIGEALFDWHTLQFEAAVERGALALEIAERHGAQVEASQACEMLALAHLALGNWEEGIGYEHRRGAAGWSPEIAVAIDAHLCLYQYKFHTDESYQQVKGFIESVAQQSTALGNLRCLAVCQFILGYLAHLQGKPGEAMANLSAALDLHRRIGSPAGVVYTLSRQIELLTAAGDCEPAWLLVQQGIEVSRQAAVRDHCLSQIYTAGIRNRLEAADSASAAEIAEAARAHDATAGPCSVCRPDLYEALAAYYLASGDADLALHYVEQALPIVDFVQNRPGRAGLLRVLAEIHASNGDNTEAGRCLLEAVAIFREAGNQYDLARTLQTWGELGATGTQQDPADLLQAADEILGRYRIYGTVAAGG